MSNIEPQPDGTAAARHPLSAALSSPWAIALFLGAGMGLAAVACNGLKWPGHRSFIFMFGAVAGTTWCGVRAPLACGGLLAGSIHAVGRLLLKKSDSPWELLAIVLAPAVLSVGWNAIASRLPQHRFLRLFVAALLGAGISLALPSLSLLAEIVSEPDRWVKLVTSSRKTWITHPAMGFLGTLAAMAVFRLNKPVEE